MKNDDPKPKDTTPIGAPSVDFLNSTVPAEPVKSTIGVRKVQPKRGVSISYFEFLLTDENLTILLLI